MFKTFLSVFLVLITTSAWAAGNQFPLPTTVTPILGQGSASINALYGDHPNLRYFSTASHTLHQDGVTDDAPAIQAAINYYCALPNGGNIQIPTGRYAIATTIVQSCSNVHLVGPGTGSVGQNVGTVNNYAEAYWKWIGGANGTILQVAPLPASGYPSTTQFLSNVNVTGIAFDCNNGLAATGLDVRSVRFSEIKGMSLGCNAYGLRLDTVPLGDTNDIQHNEIWWDFNHIQGGGIGVACQATATVFTNEEHGNCSSNTFHRVYGYINGNPGLVFGYADHNVGKGAVTCIQGGTATCVLFKGSTANTNDVAYANHLDIVAGGPVVAQGTDTTNIVGPALYNSINQLDAADGGTFIIGTNTHSLYTTDTGEFHGVPPVLDTPLPVASGGTGLVGGAWLSYTPAIFATGGTGNTFGSVIASSEQQGKTLRLNASFRLNYTTTPSKVDVPFPVGITSAAGPQVCTAIDLTTGAVLYAGSNAATTVSLVWPAIGDTNAASGNFIAVNCNIQVQ